MTDYQRDKLWERSEWLRVPAFWAGAPLSIFALILVAPVLIANATPANRSTAKATAIVGDDRHSMEARLMLGIVTRGRASTLSQPSADREAPHG